MPCTATQDRQVIVESSDKTWSTGRGNGKPLQYSDHKNLMSESQSVMSDYLQLNGLAAHQPPLSMEISKQIY